MKKKSRKLISFFTTMVVLIAIYFATLFIAPNVLENGIGGTIIFTLWGNAMALIGGNSFDKFTISQNFREELVGK